MVESTALGAATFAGLAEAVWDSLDQLGGLWQLDLECRPEVDQIFADAACRAWLPAVERAGHWASG